MDLNLPHTLISHDGLFFFPLSPYDVISFNSKFSHSSEGKRIEQENNKREENIFKVPPEKFL